MWMYFDGGGGPFSAYHTEEAKYIAELEYIQR